MCEKQCASIIVPREQDKPSPHIAPKHAEDGEGDVPYTPVKYYGEASDKGEFYEIFCGFGWCCCYFCC